MVVDEDVTRLVAAWLWMWMQLGWWLHDCGCGCNMGARLGTR